MSWTERNLAVQGYCLNAEESRALRWGLRFPAALCLVLIVIGLVLHSAVLILALVPVGAVAGWTRRHPFDLIWNHAIRYLTGAPALPVGACGLLTATNFCLPSTLLDMWWRRRGIPTPTTGPG